MENVIKHLKKFPEAASLHIDSLKEMNANDLMSICIGSPTLINIRSVYFLMKEKFTKDHWTHLLITIEDIAPVICGHDDEPAIVDLDPEIKNMLARKSPSIAGYLNKGI